ncbi:MAG: hypothetical protein HOY69_27455 [Streptomyces sp.]|nr:hypothetical protein [Streptomyces sp.]
MSLTALFCRLLLTGVFGAAAVAKAFGFRDFTDSLRTLGGVRIRSARTARAAGALLIAAELLAAGLLPAAPTARLGAALTELLLIGFVVVIAVSMRSRNRAACACFGSGGSTLGPVHIVRNAVLAAAGLAVLLRAPAAESAGRTACAVLAAAVVTALVARLDDLVALFAAPSPAPQQSSPL